VEIPQGQPPIPMARWHAAFEKAFPLSQNQFAHAYGDICAKRMRV